MKASIDQKLAVITGGCGGMGIGCAREFGKTHDLLLTDISTDRLQQTAEQLRSEGYTIYGTVAGDLADPAQINSIMSLVDSHRDLGLLIHTAGVSSGMADWQTILHTNVIATHMLLNAVESRLTMKFACVLVASIAGHLAPADKEVDALLADPPSDLLEQMEAHLLRLAGLATDGKSFSYSGLSGPAYGVSKRATIRAAALRAEAWGKKGARILSLSPGIIWTPMGKYEVEHGEAASEVLRETPLNRWGTAMDIAQAAAFLCSDKASFITGTDLRIDGGMVPARLGDSY